MAGRKVAWGWTRKRGISYDTSFRPGRTATLQNSTPTLRPVSEALAVPLRFLRTSFSTTSSHESRLRGSGLRPLHPGELAHKRREREVRAPLSACGPSGLVTDELIAAIRLLLSPRASRKRVWLPRPSLPSGWTFTMQRRWRPARTTFRPVHVDDLADQFNDDELRATKGLDELLGPDPRRGGMRVPGRPSGARDAATVRLQPNLTSRTNDAMARTRPNPSRRLSGSRNTNTPSPVRSRIIDMEYTTLTVASLRCRITNTQPNAVDE